MALNKKDVEKWMKANVANYANGGYVNRQRLAEGACYAHGSNEVSLPEHWIHSMADSVAREYEKKGK